MGSLPDEELPQSPQTFLGPGPHLQKQGPECCAWHTPANSSNDDYSQAEHVSMRSDRNI